MQVKHHAGYYKENVNNEAVSYLKNVLNERKEEILNPK